MIDAIIRVAVEDFARKVVLAVSVGMVIGAAITFGILWLIGAAP